MVFSQKELKEMQFFKYFQENYIIITCLVPKPEIYSTFPAIIAYFLQNKQGRNKKFKIWGERDNQGFLAKVFTVTFFYPHTHVLHSRIKVSTRPTYSTPIPLTTTQLTSVE